MIARPEQGETPAAVLEELARHAAAGEAHRQEFEAARWSLNEAMRRFGAEIVAAEDAMRASRRRFIQSLSQVAPGCTRLSYNTTSRSPETQARLQRELDDVMDQLRARGVNLGVVLAEWLGAGHTVVDVNWQPDKLEFAEAVQLAARIAAQRRRQL